MTLLEDEKAEWYLIVHHKNGDEVVGKRELMTDKEAESFAAACADAWSNDTFWFEQQNGDWVVIPIALIEAVEVRKWNRQ